MVNKSRIYNFVKLPIKFKFKFITWQFKHDSKLIFFEEKFGIIK